MKIFRRDRLSIIAVTCFLIAYTALAFLNFSTELVATLFTLSPFMIGWMVYSVLKYGKPSRELNKGEEYGYSDEK